MIAKAADGIVGGGGKVNGLVYIGHGETDGKRLLPRINEQLKVKDAVEAAKLGPGGAFVAYGCHVSTGNDIDELRKNGVHVYATQRFTWTTAGGQVAVGDETGPDNKKYGRLKDLDALQ